MKHSEANYSYVLVKKAKQMKKVKQPAENMWRKHLERL